MRTPKAVASRILWAAPWDSHIALALLTIQFLLVPMFLLTPKTAGASLLMASHQALLVLTVGGLSRQRTVVGLGLGLIALSAFLRSVGVFQPGLRDAIANLAVCLALGAVQAAAIGRFFSARAATAGLVSQAVSLYLLTALVWTLAYAAVESLAPGSFRAADERPLTSRDLHYFSYVTQTTLGYGDISPVTEVARALAIAQAVVGQMFVAIALSRLVGLQVAGEGQRQLTTGRD